MGALEKLSEARKTAVGRLSDRRKYIGAVRRQIHRDDYDDHDWARRHDWPGRLQETNSGDREIDTGSRHKDDRVITRTAEAM